MKLEEYHFLTCFIYAFRKGTHYCIHSDWTGGWTSSPSTLNVLACLCFQRQVSTNSSSGWAQWLSICKPSGSLPLTSMRPLFYLSHVPDARGLQHSASVYGGAPSWPIVSTQKWLGHSRVNPQTMDNPTSPAWGCLETPISAWSAPHRVGLTQGRDHRLPGSTSPTPPAPCSARLQGVVFASAFVLNYMTISNSGHMASIT